MKARLMLLCGQPNYWKLIESWVSTYHKINLGFNMEGFEGS